MLQDMHSMDASCIFHVNVGMLNHVEQGEIWIVTGSTAGKVILSIQHNMIGNVCFLYYPGDILRQASADVPFLKEWTIYICQSCDFGCCELHFIAVSKLVTLAQLIVSHGTLGNPRNMQCDAAQFIISIMYSLYTTYAILT
jgi:hypothetical protein